ncbi:MAG: 2-oxo acid dehydrogenase subunit E2 [Clostridia bacterium]|nr:2-oxo acid dehydrogenase subunit E2 [Clostridia bacterium]
MPRKRADGYYVKGINPYTKIMPHIMPERSDSMNMTFVEVECDSIDSFIREMGEKGIKYTYNDIMFAAMVRLYAMRPALNRFVMNRRIYQHNDITVSFAVKKRMLDNSEDTTVKLHFNGSESIDEVKEALAKVVKDNTGDKAYNSVDKTAKILTNAPHFMIKFVVGVLKWLDKRGWLPGAIIEISPFHNSFFITLMKSIKGDAILHHCYNFGTTGIFIAVGKEKMQPVVKGGDIVIKKILPIGVVMDERFCDGLYFVNSMRLLRKILANPKTLLEKYEVVEDNTYGVRSEEDKKKYKELAKLHEEKKKEAKKAKNKEN